MTRSQTLDQTDAANNTIRLTVHEVVRETCDAVTLVFEALPDQPLSYRAGQFLTLRVPHPAEPLARCYSLSSSPAVDTRLAVTVKRVRDGRASNWIFDNATAGSTFDVIPPSGMFSPRRWDVPLLLLAAGSGITPIMSIIRTGLAAHQNSMQLIYANTDRESVIFARELERLVAQYPRRLDVTYVFDDEHGLPDAHVIGEKITTSAAAHTYICGPTPFMAQARAAALGHGINGADIHNEVFVSLRVDAFTARASVDTSTGEIATAMVELDGEQHQVEWPEDTVLLDVLLDRGLDAPYVCREGTCGGCAFTLRSGEVEMRDNQTLDSHDLARGTRLACQSMPRSDHLDIAFDL